ncbi:MAG TPA: hypothetical protein DGG94_22615 [Micromonosporaceae bacterium]|nr:hypothetical protein [Micromonosporaceae bacterium]HCU52551.1 hypothetical protein [Micromonosporaceae bacterium]
MELASPPAEHLAPEQRAEDRPLPRAGASLLLVVATAVGAVAAAVWIGAVIATAGHGLDTSDEGYYLLSYRWWDTNFRTFTGIQYLYGPVFEVLGYNIAGLRLFRLFTIVAAHLLLGWTFMGWLRQRRPSAPPSRLWEFAGVAAILAAGGLVYGWLPLSPGYNDVSLLGSFVAAAMVLKTATLADQDKPIPMWIPAALGPVVVSMVLAKWASAIIILGLVGLAGAIVLAPKGIRGIARFIGLVIASSLVTVAIVQVLLVSLTTALPEMLAVNKLAAANTNSPRWLLGMYWDTTYALTEQVLRTHVVLLLGAALSLVSRHRIVQGCAAILLAAGLGISVWRVATDGGLEAGAGNLDLYPASVLATLFVALVAGLGVVLAGRLTKSRASSVTREGRRGWAILGMLALLPAAQAMGTGNPIYMMAINAFATWMAIVIAVLTGIETAPTVTRIAVASAALAAVVLSACIGANGVWQSPYRTPGRAHTTATAAGVAALDSVKLDPATAQQFSLLYQRLKPYVEPEGRAIMAFDEMAGVVFLLSGRSVGEAWYSDLDRERTATGIAAECTKGQPWWGQRKPILLFHRAVSENEVNALRSCGLVFATDYRLLAPKEETMGLSVYVPAAEIPKG